MDTRNYAVYVRVKTNIDGTTTDIMIMNVRSTTNGGAEHQILDNYRGIDNALAFDMETEMTLAAPYFSKARAFDIKDFDRRAKSRAEHLQAVIDEQLDDIAAIRAKNRDYMTEIKILEHRVRVCKSLIEENNRDIDDIQNDLDSFCKAFNMLPIHSDEEYIQGIA